MLLNKPESIILVANTIMGSDGRLIIENELQMFVFTYSDVLQDEAVNTYSFS